MRKILGFLFILVLASNFSFAQGTLVIAQGTDPATLDPHNSTDSPTATVQSHMYETLFELLADGRIVPHLAESYTVSDDGLTWTLQIRSGVSFHDGAPLNAEAVKASLERFLDPDNAFTFRFLLTRIQEIEALDDMTVAFMLSTPFAPLLAHLTHSSTAIISPAALASDLDLSENVAGTGPFKLGSWDRGERITLVRNDDYWGEAPVLDSVVFLTVPENTTRMALVETGDAHVAVRVPPQDIMRLNALPNVTVENVSSVRTIYIYFNHAKDPFTDVRVRRAINHAIDKEEIAEFVLGGAVRVSDAPVSPGVFGYSPVGSYDYNPELARELLSEAGQSDLSFTLHCPTGRYLQDIQICEAIQSQLAAVGVTADIETIEWTSYLQFINRGVEENTVDLAMLGWGTVTGDADYGLYALFHTAQHTPGGSNRSFYSNSLVDDLLDEARSIGDNAMREQLYTDAMQILWNDAAWLYLHSETQLVAVRDNVKGLIIHPTERILAFNTSLE